MKPVIVWCTCNGREEYAEFMRNALPSDAIENFDDFTDSGKYTSTAWFNYQRGWEIAGMKPTIQMDDDVILTSDWYNKVIAEINKRPNEVIQFFSMRKADIEIGSRYDTGAKFMGQLCYYLPFGMARAIHKFSYKFYDSFDDGVSPSDTCIAAFLKLNKLRYWIVVPNLVDHRVGKSAVDSRRSSARVSKTFIP